MVIETSIGRGGDESAPASASASPRGRLKFMLSHGGKILPRPGDGQLKYVGGETRVLAVPRDITFSELMKKLGTLVDGEMVLKYQVIPDDLEALVSVRSDEDLKHMFDEHDRNEIEGTSKLRAFVFPSSPVILENQIITVEPHLIEQRYIDAINGIIRPTINGRLTPSYSKRSYFCASDNTSPKSLSPDAKTNDSNSPFEHVLVNGCHDSRIGVHKVQSSPSFYSFNNTVPLQSSNLSNHQAYQQHYHYHQGYQQPQQHYAGCQTPNARPPQELRMDRLSSFSIGQHDFSRVAMGQQPSPSQIYPPGRPNVGNEDSSRYSCHDEYLMICGNGRPGSDGVPMTPHHMWD
ncbi:hypothetical protein SLE2022_146450 [Rubroshorea leprosula]